jgi:hypothetical protein
MKPGFVYRTFCAHIRAPMNAVLFALTRDQILFVTRLHHRSDVG